MGNIEAEVLLADKAYDSEEIIEKATELGITVAIPPRSNRKDKREYDRYLYKFRHLVENAFLKLKEWRGIATRYAKNAKSFLSIIYIRCLMWWAKIGGRVVGMIDERV